MHSALSIASIVLAASGALALPQATNSTSSTLVAPSYGKDTAVIVTLSSQSTETGSQTTFDSVTMNESKAPVGSTGPFETILIQVGKDADQDLRCQALDERGIPVIGLRGANVDTTFSDGTSAGKGGEWTFKHAQTISRIVCDPAFVKLTPPDFDVTVQLSSSVGELATQTVFHAFEGHNASAPTGSHGPFDSITVTVGKGLNPELRCRLVDARGRFITAVREPNTDTTFSDKGKGAWTFEGNRLRHVKRIACNEVFRANPQ